MKIKTIHPAHKLPFQELIDGLNTAVDQKLVFARSGPDGLMMYRYSSKCVYDLAWTDITIAARGLIIDPIARRIVATPFPKFFNYGERAEAIPDMPFETTEMLDGSLIILYWHQDRWRCATRGSFDSEQAIWAQKQILSLDLTPLCKGVTYLAEATYPENRIVISYADASLRFLSAYDHYGHELSYADVENVAASIGLRSAKRHFFTSLSELAIFAKSLPSNQEGFVVRFDNGHRLKLKGDAYLHLHALISGVTPLNIWSLIAARMDLETVRRDLPEEYWWDFDAIVETLQIKIDLLQSDIQNAVDSVAHLSDKEVSLKLLDFSPEVRSFIFACRKNGGLFKSSITRDKFFRLIRPTANALEGYKPSSAIDRLLREVG